MCLSVWVSHWDGFGWSSRCHLVYKCLLQVRRSQTIRHYFLVLCISMVAALVNNVQICILGRKPYITPQRLGELFYVRKCQEYLLPADLIGPIPSVEQWPSETFVGPVVLNHIYFSLFLWYFSTDHLSFVDCSLVPGFFHFRTQMLTYFEVCLKTLKMYW